MPPKGGLSCDNHHYHHSQKEDIHMEKCIMTVSAGYPGKNTRSTISSITIIMFIVTIIIIITMMISTIIVVVIVSARWWS